MRRVKLGGMKQEQPSQVKCIICGKPSKKYMCRSCAEEIKVVGAKSL